MNLLAAVSALFLPPTFGRTAPDLRDTGPRSLIIGYRVSPAKKAALVATLKADLARRLKALHASGALTRYHVLVNRYVDSGVWDALAVLDFRSPEDLAHWKAVEAQAPAGLDPPSLEAVTAVETTVSDAIRTGRAASEPTLPVYLVVPYDYLVSTDAYVAYVDGYLIPQTQGWMRAGVLNAYNVYVARYGAGRPWSSLLLLSYRGDAGLGQRDRVVKQVRARLAGNANWAAFANGKEKVRTEKQPMVADEIAGS